MDSGITTKCRAKELSHGLMEESTRATMQMIKKKEMVSFIPKIFLTPSAALTVNDFVTVGQRQQKESKKILVYDDFWFFEEDQDEDDELKG